MRLHKAIHLLLAIFNKFSGFFFYKVDMVTQVWIFLKRSPNNIFGGYANIIHTNFSGKLHDSVVLSKFYLRKPL